MLYFVVSSLMNGPLNARVICSTIIFCFVEQKTHIKIGDYEGYGVYK